MGNYRDMIAMPRGVHEALWQMFKDGPIWDGNLVDKEARKWLKTQGYVEQSSGHNFLTATGVDLAVSIGMDRRKEKDAGDE